MWLFIARATAQPKIECFLRGDKYIVVHNQSTPRQGACQLKDLESGNSQS